MFYGKGIHALNEQSSYLKDLLKHRLSYLHKENQRVKDVLIILKLRGSFPKDNYCEFSTNIFTNHFQN